MNINFCDQYGLILFKSMDVSYFIHISILNKVLEDHQGNLFN